jgi:hypothetical protein
LNSLEFTILGEYSEADIRLFDKEASLSITGVIQNYGAKNEKGIYKSYKYLRFVCNRGWIFGCYEYYLLSDNQKESYTENA